MELNLLISHRALRNVFEIGLKLNSYYMDSNCGVYDPHEFFKCIIFENADVSVQSKVKFYWEFGRIYIWNFITFMYLNFDHNGDIFEVVYDTSTATKANMI